MPQKLSLRRLATIAFATFLLASCGGGGSGDGGSTPGSSPAPTTAPPTVQAISPSEGAPDTVVTVTGSGLSRVTTVSVSGMAAVYTTVSDTQLTFRVPAGSTTGSVVLTGTGFSVQASASFRVVGVPTVTAVSATNAAISSNILLTGQNLDRASAFSIGATPLPILSASATTASVRAPSIPVSGTLMVEDRAGGQRATVHSLAIWQPMSITSISPTSALPGETITVTGFGLENVEGVAFTSGSLPVPLSIANLPTLPATKSATSLTVKVPPTATTGPIAVFSDYQDSGVLSSASLTVMPKVIVSRLEPVVTPASTPPPHPRLLHPRRLPMSPMVRCSTSRRSPSRCRDR